MSDSSVPDETILSVSSDGQELPTLLVTPPRSAPASEPGADPDAATPFVLGRRIAQGGMGAIIEADDCKLGRKIAVKVMRLDRGAGEEQKQRFIQEAVVLGRLEHPNIVPIHDLGRDADGQLYYSMKLVNGRTLQAVLDDLQHEHPEALMHYTLERLLTIFRKVCDALAFAHSRQVIHRDLKPENIMVGEFGEVLVMDWGIAKVLGGVDFKPAAQDAPQIEKRGPVTLSVSQTLEGAVMGTPNYMSPEQAMGKVVEIDARSDVFSLGGILYAILTLRPPVEGKDVWEVLEKVSSATITPPSSFGLTTGTGRPVKKDEVLEAKLIKPLPHIAGGRVPAALNAVVMKALSLDKARRYPDVAAFSADVEAYQNGFATSAENAGAWTQLRLLMKRHRGVTAMLGVLLLASIGFVLKVMSSERKATRNAIAATQNEQKAVAEQAATRRALAQAKLALADAAMHEQDGRQMQAQLAEVPEDLRDQAWDYLLEQSDTSQATIVPHLTADMSGGGVAFATPHPTRPGVFAIVSAHHWVALVDARTGLRSEEFKLDFIEKAVNSSFVLAFTADGTKLAVGRDEPKVSDKIVIYDFATKQKLREWPARSTRWLQFTPDGTQLFELVSDDRLNMWDAEGKLLWSYPMGKGLHAARMTLDGTRILAFSANKRLQLLNASDGSLVRQMNDPASTVEELALSPSNKGAIVTNVAGFVQQHEFTDDRMKLQNKIVSHAGFTGVDYASDGRSFVTLANLPGGRVSLQTWMIGSGDMNRMLLGGGGAGYSLVIHPLSDDLIVWGSTLCKVWNIARTPELWLGYADGFKGADLAFWTDDLLLTRNEEFKRTVLMDLSVTPPVRVWESAAAESTSAALSADGRFAAVTSPGSQRIVTLLRRDGKRVETVREFPVLGGSRFQRLSPDGSRLFGGDPRYSGQIMEWFDTRTGKAGGSLAHPDARVVVVNDARWLDASRLLALVTVKVARGQPGSEERIVLWDTTTGAVLRALPHSAQINALAISPDGRRFATGGAEMIVRIHDADTFVVRRQFRAHNDAILSLAWHPQRDVVASGSQDGGAKLWDANTGMRLEEIRGDSLVPTSLVFSPGGLRLGCMSKSGRIVVWEPASLKEQPAKQGGEAEWEDLIAKLRRPLVEAAGNGWALNGHTLISSHRPHAILPLPGGLFADTSYTLRLSVRQMEVQDAFTIILPVGDREVMFKMEGWPKEGHFTGLMNVDQHDARTVPGAVKGKLIMDHEPHELDLRVILEGDGVRFTSQLDGEPLFAWNGPLSALSLPAAHQAAPHGKICLVSYRSDWAVEEVRVKRE